MTYRVIIADEVFDRVREFSHYVAVEQQSPQNAETWLAKVFAEINSLCKMPNRYPIAPEDAQSHLTIRMMRVDRCLFLYHVDEENNVVSIVKFRHGSEQPYRLD